MRKFGLFAIGLCMSATTLAQTLKVHIGAVTVAVPAAKAGDMVYGAGGTDLTIMGKTYAISAIDSITVDNSVVADSSVFVTYKGNTAHVLLSGDIAPKMNVNVVGADVSAVAALDLQSEVRYTLTGKSEDGSFFMDGEYKARVELQNLDLTNADGAAIDIANGKRIDIVLPTGTTTRLADGAGGLHKACFFVNGHPEFGGGGTLYLTGNSKHAFASDEYTRIKHTFGKLKVVKAVGDGLHIEQYFLQQGGMIDVQNTQGDCVDVSVTKNPADLNNGQVFIEAGKMKLMVMADDTKGLKCDSAMTISGGDIEAGVAGLGTKGLSVGGNLLIQQKTATPTNIRMVVTGSTYMPGDPVLQSKCRGIKGKGNLLFDGGKIEISATGKGSKAVSIDGVFTYLNGTYNCAIEDINGIHMQ